MQCELNVNGTCHAIELQPRETLLDVLRERLGLKGAHAGCEHGVCGACTILVEGQAVRSCLILAVQAEGMTIETIEAIAPEPGTLDPIQDAFCAHHGLQCGYCTPAMILTAKSLLARNARPSRDEIVEAISGNICRCTGYGQIIEAIEDAAQRLQSGAAS